MLAHYFSVSTSKKYIFSLLVTILITQQVNGRFLNVNSHKKERAILHFFTLSKSSGEYAV